MQSLKLHTLLPWHPIIKSLSIKITEVPLDLSQPIKKQHFTIAVLIEESYGEILGEIL